MAQGGLLDLLLPPGEDPPVWAIPAWGPPPGLARLLPSLGGLLGGAGLSPPMRAELQQARLSLSRSRAPWLLLELLWRLLGELSRDPRELQPQVLQFLEQALVQARLRRGRPEIAAMVPQPQPFHLLPRLLPELQRRLKEKREFLQEFLLGNPKIPKIPPKIPQKNPEKNPQKNPKNPQKKPQNLQNFAQNFAPNPSKFLEIFENSENSENSEIPPKISQILGDLGAGLRRERLRERRLRAELQKMEVQYPQALLRCVSRLSQLRLQGALQARLDGGRGRYLLAKGEAVLLKSRLEELKVLLDTYPAPTIEAHRRIRAELSEARSAAEAEAAILGAELATHRQLGPEFRDLALELGQIRQELAQKRWALRQLRSPPPDVTASH